MSIKDKNISLTSLNRIGLGSNEFGSISIIYTFRSDVFAFSQKKMRYDNCRQ